MAEYTINPDGVSIKGCSYIYAPKGQAGEYAPLACNPYSGCGHKCVYCVSGDTLITMADGSVKPIRDIEVGDIIMGVVFSEFTLDKFTATWVNEFTATSVLAKVKNKKPAWVVTLEDGTKTICSADHRWLTKHGWKYTARDSFAIDQYNRPVIYLNDLIHKYSEYHPVPSASYVASIEPLGETIEMFDIMTGTENFIANGMISHNCYVPAILKVRREDFDKGAVERPNFIQLLTKDARKYQAMGITEQVMLSFTTDPYHPGDNRLTRRVIEIIQSHGMAVCTLTKGGGRAISDLDLFRPERDAFASTLTSLDDAFSRKWERGAALPGSRIATLRAFHEAGIFTWVSLEPTLDTASSLAIVRETREFIDLYKIGRANYLPMTSTTNWCDYTLRMIDLCQSLGVKHYIKKDLQCFLPAGYDNPRRVPQNHGGQAVERKAPEVATQISLF